MIEVVQEYDFISMVETKIDARVTSASLALPGYVMQRQDRDGNGIGGGVLSYIREQYLPVSMEDTQKKYVDKRLELTITRITVKGPLKHIYLVSVYRPPGTSVAWFEAFEALMMEIIVMGPLIVLGDLNADLMRPRIDMNRVVYL